MIFMACFSVFVVLLTVFMEDGPDEEIRERHKWRHVVLNKSRSLLKCLGKTRIDPLIQTLLRWT